jgi:hypothetical protein
VLADGSGIDDQSRPLGGATRIRFDARNITVPLSQQRGALLAPTDDSYVGARPPLHGGKHGGCGATCPQ